MRVWLKVIRKERGFTQSEVAEAVGISRCFYTQIESTYHPKGLSPKVAIKIAEILQFDWTWFFQENLIPGAIIFASHLCLKMPFVRLKHGYTQGLRIIRTSDGTAYKKVAP